MSKRERSCDARWIIGLALWVPVCASAQEPELLLKLVPPVEIEIRLGRRGTGGVIVDAVGEICRFNFRKGVVGHLEYVSRPACAGSVRAGSARAAMIRILLAWVDERYSAARASLPNRVTRTRVRAGGGVVVRQRPVCELGLADSASPCGPMALGDSTYVWVDWPEA
ncbi:MAG: hypothetical protein IPH48_15605 [bacterium]|nr:hypothetical protein [bacterium]